MKFRAINTVTAVATTLLPAAFAPQARSADFYIGDAAAEGQAVTSAGGPRADTVALLTYVLHGGTAIYTPTENQQLMLTEVNFFADRSGTLTPFVARYDSVNTQQGGSYEILAIGDPLVVTSSDNTLGPSAGDHLENRAFTVGGTNPVISVSAGDLIAVGWTQSGNVVYLKEPGPGTADFISNGDALDGASVGGNLTLNSNWAFDRDMRFNIGVDVATSATIRLVIAQDGANLNLTWNSQAGKVYDLLSSPDLTTEPETWAVWGGNENIDPTPDENLLTIPRPGDPVRFFAIAEKDAPPLP